MTESIDRLVTRVLDLAVKSAPRQHTVDEDAPTFDEHLSAAQPTENAVPSLEDASVEESAPRWTQSGEDGLEEDDPPASRYDQIVDQGHKEDTKQQAVSNVEADSIVVATKSSAPTGVATEAIAASSTTNGANWKGNDLAASESPHSSTIESLRAADVNNGEDQQQQTPDNTARQQETLTQTGTLGLGDELDTAASEPKPDHWLEQAVPQPIEKVDVAPDANGVVSSATERLAVEEQLETMKREPVESGEAVVADKQVSTDATPSGPQGDTTEPNSQIPVLPSTPPSEQAPRTTTIGKGDKVRERRSPLTEQVAAPATEETQAKIPIEPTAVEASTSSIDTGARTLHDAVPQPSTVASTSTPSADRAPLTFEAPSTSSTRDGTQVTEAQRDRFLQRVASAFQNAQRSDGEVRIRLHPPELGALRMQIKVDDGQLVARLETETQTARKLLLDNLPALRDRLAGQEIRIERFDVDVQDQSSGNRHQQTASRDGANGHGQDRSESRAPNGRNEQNERGEQDSPNEETSPTQQSTDSVLNVVI
ncbi:MAG: flagellar hook-length control protein FliK [Pirellulales bacterium]|nr:flagellar hook-length control protein FliK [Pirellulales bacterium]